MGSSETEYRQEVIQWYEKSTPNTFNSDDEISIVITGFGPFREHYVNASWESVKLINPESIPWPSNLPKVPLRISFYQLEVAYTTVHKHVPELWQKRKPHLTVHVGVSGIAKAITLEQYAHNGGYCSPDVRECVPENNTCLKGGYELLQSGFDMLDVVNKLNSFGPATGLRAELSHDAGRFLCDFTYYRSLSINPERSAFIHVPPVGRPWTAEQMANGIAICVSEFLKQLQDKDMLL